MSFEARFYERLQGLGTISDWLCPPGMHSVLLGSGTIECVSDIPSEPSNPGAPSAPVQRGGHLPVHSLGAQAPVGHAWVPIQRSQVPAPVLATADTGLVESYSGLPPQPNGGCVGPYWWYGGSYYVVCCGPGYPSCGAGWSAGQWYVYQVVPPPPTPSAPIARGGALRASY